MSPLDALVFAAVLAAAFTGAIRGRRPSIERFFGEPGERPWRAAAGLAGADLSALTMVALPAYAFGLDLRAFWLVAGAVLGRAACALFLVPGLYGRGPTLYAALESAFGPAARRWGAWLFLLSRAAGSGVRLAAAAVALAALCGGGPWQWALACAAVALALTLPRGLPGSLAAAVVQCAAVAAAGLAAAAVCAYLADGGTAALWEIAAQGGRLSLGGAGRELWAGFWSHADAPLGSFLAGALTAGATFAGDHEGAQKWLAAPDEEAASRAALAGAAIAAACSILYVVLGTAVYGLYRLTPAFSQPERGSDVAVHFAATLLPGGLRGLFAAALLLASCDLPALSMAASARYDLGFGARSRSLTAARAAAAAAILLCLAWAFACSGSDWLGRSSLVFSTIGFGALFGAAAAAAITTASGESALLGFFGALALGAALGIACERGAITLAWTWLGPLTSVAAFLLCGPYGFAHH